MIYDSDYEVRLAELEALGGDMTKTYDSVYEVDLAILEIIQGGGGGGGALIDDNNVSTGTTWSSFKITQELADAGFDTSIVSTLPASGDKHTIYFTPSVDPSTNNSYDEYMYVSNTWEKVGSTEVDLSEYAKIDDNNVSTGTVFSSAKCEGSSYYDISTYISSQINLWQFFQDASNALQDTSTRVYLRDGENLWVDVEMFPLSSHKHVDVGNVSADDVAVIVRYYNTSATNITQDGEWFRIYAQYAYNHDTMEIYDYANFMWGYYPYNDEAMAGLMGPTGQSNFWLDGDEYLVVYIYGWDGWNNPSVGSDTWGWIKIYTTNNDLAWWMQQHYGTSTYGSHINLRSSDPQYIDYFTFAGMTLVHDGGYVKWDNTLFTPNNSTESHDLYLPILDKSGVTIGQYLAGEAWTMGINGDEIRYFRSNKGSAYGGDSFYAPTTAGTQGQYLVSNGSGAPVWQDLEVASDYVISDADASSGTYSPDVSSFYLKTIDANTVQGVQIKVTDSSIVKVVDLQETYSTLMDGSIFAVEEGETASITVEDQGSVSHTISIDATGNITDTDSTGCVTSEYISSLGYNGYVYNTGSYTFSTLSGDLYPVDSETVTYDSYYLPSSARIYDANVELWLMTTENGVTWENIHYLITNNSITRDVSTGSFGPDTSNMVSFASVTQAEYDALVLAGTIDPQTLYYINNA